MQTKLGQLLRKEREALKMTQNEFADYLKLSQSTYERIENDKNHDIRVECMNKILKKVDIPIEIFISPDILARYCVYVIPKSDKTVKQFLSKEFSKIVKKVERQFSNHSKSDI
ncbi:MAG: helix-turn-helix transcriptional regulator [Flavobacterium sp.]